MDNMMNIIIFISLILVGYFAGKYAEKKHYKSIKEREKGFLKLPAVNLKKTWSENDTVLESKLVAGSVVVSLDYFKRICANFINIIGGRVVSYETLLDRGRREAILRMKEEVKDYDIIVNMRIETSSISSRTKDGKNQSVGCIEVLAYGTAVKFAK